MPLLIGLSWLASFLGTIFGALISWFLQYMTKRLAIVLATVVAIVALTTAFYEAISALVSSIAVEAPAEVIQAAGMFLPSNTKACLAAILTAITLRWVYEWQVKILMMKTPSA